MTRRLLLRLQTLEDRTNPVAPAAPVIIEPFTDGQITGTFDINMQTDPAVYFDADNHSWAATDWLIRETASQTTVWQLPYTSSPPLTFYRVDFSDGAFVGPLAGKTELSYSTSYQLVVRYRDSNNEFSAPAVRSFSTAAATTPVPGAGTWLVRPGYTLDVVQTGMRMPVNIAFVPNPGPNPTDPLYYVTELYGSIQVVLNNGTKQTFATGLLDYNPQGPISGVGEQGLTGLAVERDTTNPAIYNLYVSMLWDNGSPPGAPNHYPKVEKITSTSGGLSLASRTTLLNMQPETQGQSHQVSNVTIGPDGFLYVHVGDGFDSSTALNLDMYRGKVLRMTKDGAPVSTNPFYNVSNGINSRDYIFTYGHRNPFGGAWDPVTNKHWVVENGNGLDRMVDLVSGASYGWNGNDTTLSANAKFVWNPSTAPVNMDFVHPSRQGGSGYPAEAQGHTFVGLSGTTYASGPLQRSKGIVEFSDLVTLSGNYLATQPSFLVKYNGSGKGTVVAVAAGPDGIYFSDFYEDTGTSGATAAGSSLYRVRYVGNAGGQVPTVATPAAASPATLSNGNTTTLTVLGADEGGEAALTYSWGLLGSPPAPVTFSTNGSNAAKSTVATFTANGSYNFYVAIRDIGGQVTLSSVVVTVASLLTETGNGLNAQYWSNTNFTGTTLTRTDPAINFNFGTGGPGTVGTDTFSARWTGFIVPRYSETYTFSTWSDDGARLWVNNVTSPTPLVNGWFDQSATTPVSATIALTANTVYAIKMEYYENSGDAQVRLEWSSPSQQAEPVPQGRLYTSAPTTPAAPSNLVLTSPSSSQINLSWTDNATNEAGFRIERSTDGVSYGLVGANGQNVTAFSNPGLAAGTTYFYRVQSTNPGGSSAFVTASLPTRPSTPVGISVAAASTVVNLSWPGVFGATSYRIYRSTTAGDQNPALIASNVTGGSFQDTGLLNNTSYFYKLTAVNAGGESGPSDENVGIPRLPTPAGIVVNGGATQRSRITSIALSFAEAVTAAHFNVAAAVQLKRTATASIPAGAVNDIVQTGPPAAGHITAVQNGASGILLTFDNNGSATIPGTKVEYGSLTDGYWQLLLPGSYSGPLNDTNLRRLFGDSSSAAFGTVDTVDLTAFGNAFNSTSIAFDFNNDGVVNTADLTAFGNKFGNVL